MKEDELRERLLVLLPSLQQPTFTVIQGRFTRRLKRGVLDRTLRHMRQDGLVAVVAAEKAGHRVHRYVLTQDGLAERARLLLSRRRRAS